MFIVLVYGTEPMSWKLSRQQAPKWDLSNDRFIKQIRYPQKTDSGKGSLNGSV
jgi:hypothetical protein